MQCNLRCVAGMVDSFSILNCTSHGATNNNRQHRWITSKVVRVTRPRMSLFLFPLFALATRLKRVFFVTLISTGGLFMLNGKNRLFRCVALAVASRVFLTMDRYVRLEASVDPPARKIGQNATAKR